MLISGKIRTYHLMATRASAQKKPRTPKAKLGLCDIEHKLLQKDSTLTCTQLKEYIQANSELAIKAAARHHDLFTLACCLVNNEPTEGCAAIKLSSRGRTAGSASKAASPKTSPVNSEDPLVLKICDGKELEQKELEEFFFRRHYTCPEWPLDYLQLFAKIVTELETKKVLSRRGLTVDALKSFLTFLGAQDLKDKKRDFLLGLALQVFEKYRSPEEEAAEAGTEGEAEGEAKGEAEGEAEAEGEGEADEAETEGEGEGEAETNEGEVEPEAAAGEEDKKEPPQPPAPAKVEPPAPVTAQPVLVKSQPTKLPAVSKAPARKVKIAKPVGK